MRLTAQKNPFTAWNEDATMPTPTIMDDLTELFRDLFGDDTIVLSPETTADDIEGWDSVKHISLIVAVEDRFSIKIKSSEIDGLRNVGDLVQTIEGRLANAGR